MLPNVVAVDSTATGTPLGSSTSATASRRSAPRGAVVLRPHRAGSVPPAMSAGDEQPRRMTGRRGGWPAALGLAALVGAASLALPATLGYDAWAWTVWGRQLAHLDLATTAGPSFKPLPVLALAPLSVLGGATPVVWMGLMRAAAVLSLVLAYRVGARLAGPLAGAVAALSLALSADLYRTALLGSAEPVLIALTLGAVDRHLAGRRDWALVLIAAGGAHPPRGVGPAGRSTACTCGCASRACARWSSRPSCCRRRCGSAWTGSARAIRCTPARPRPRPPRAAPPTPACPPSRSCAARPTRSSSPRSCSRRSGSWLRGPPPRPPGAVARRARAGLDRGGGDHGRGRLHRHAALPGRAGGGAVRRGRRGARVAAGRRAASGARASRWPARSACWRSCPRSCAPARTRACSASRAARPTSATSCARAVARVGGRAAVLRAGRPAINPWLQTTLAWELDVPLSGVQATWSSSRRHPHWAPPALVFRAPARLAGPRPALPAGVTRRRRGPIGTLAGAARRGVSAAQALP